jgi:hypothetical protein
MLGHGDGENIKTRGETVFAVLPLPGKTSSWRIINVI